MIQTYKGVISQVHTHVCRSNLQETGQRTLELIVREIPRVERRSQRLGAFGTGEQLATG